MSMNKEFIVTALLFSAGIGILYYLIKLGLFEAIGDIICCILEEL